MRGIVTAFAKNPVFANFMTLSIILAGSLAGMTMNRELFPEFSLDMVSVRVVWPGADPEDVEEGICTKIEEAIDGLEGIKEYTSVASENYGNVMIEAYQGADIDEVKERVVNAIDTISTFPEDAEEPIVEEIVLREEVMGVALSGEGIPERTLKERAEDIKDDLRHLPQISQVQIIGTRDYEINIEVSEDRLREYGLTFDQVAGLVRAGNMNLGGGNIRTEGEELRLRTVGRKYRGADFAKIELLGMPNGEVITLDRVATIRDGFTEDPVISRFDGKPTVNIIVLKTPDEDTLNIAAAVKEYVKEKVKELPPGVTLAAWNDQSKPLRDRINLLVKNGLQGLVLVFIVLWLFLDFRLSFWVGLGMPIAACGALGLMYLCGMTLNMISLFGLIMVMGIVVDDATVIGEAVYIHRRTGKSALQSAIDGVMEVAAPVVAALVTSMVAFMPLMYVSGVSGRFIRILPITVIFCLVISLIECLFMFPAHLSHLPDPNENVDAKLHPVRRMGVRFHAWTSGGLEWFAKHVYEPFLVVALRWRYVSLCVAIASFMLTVGMMENGIIKQEVLPELDGDLVTATLEFSEGTPLEVTQHAVEDVEAALRRLIGNLKAESGDPPIKHIYSVAGSTLNDGPQPPRYGNHLGAVRAELLEAEKRGINANALMSQWEKEVGPIPGLQGLTFAGFNAGPPGAAIEIWVQGNNLENLHKAAEELKAKLATYDGVYQIQHDLRPGKNEIQLSLKPEARSLGLTVADLATQVYSGYFGQEALRFQRGRDDVRVKVRYPIEDRRQIDELEKVRIRTPLGSEVPLFTVANVSFGPGSSNIRRTDGQRRVSVTAEIDSGRANTKEIFDDLNDHYFGKLRNKYPGVNIAQRGEKQKMTESLASLGVTYPLALLGIYLIIATVFRSYIQPMIIMFTVPFGIIGAVWAHLIFGYPLSLMSIFGIVALSGVVVNDAIVLIDYINEIQRNGTPIFESLRRGGGRRFRPIVLNSATTFMGLAPLLASRDVQAQFLIPMALSIGAGVCFSTVLSLVLVPCLLGIMNDGRRFTHYVWYRNWPEPEDVEPTFVQGREERGTAGLTLAEAEGEQW